MGISTIPNPDFVFCKDCPNRRRKKNLKQMGKKGSFYWCDIWNKELRGQKGCNPKLARKRLSN